MGRGAVVLGFSHAQRRRRCEHKGTAQQHLHILSEICSPKLSFLSLSDLTMSYSKARACARMRLLDGLTGPRRWQAAAARKASFFEHLVSGRVYWLHGSFLFKELSVHGCNQII